MMRDEPAGAKIPIFEPSTYNRDHLRAAERKLRALGTKNIEECLVEARAKAIENFKRDKRYYQETVASYNALREKYEAMLAKVKAWHPPTPDHEGLKKFMIEQIEQSINFDCNLEYLTAPKRKSPQRTLLKEFKSLAWDFAYHSKEWNAEVERTRRLNQWVKDLVKSLGISAEAAGVEVPKRKPATRRTTKKATRKEK